MKKPQVYFDIVIGNQEAGRVTFELHSDVAPKTAENFRQLCTGEKGISLSSKERLHYLGCKFFKTVKGERIISGDILKNDGSGPGESVYGQYFNDEVHANRHSHAGVLAMETLGDGKSNNSQFYITLRATPHLNRSNVVFGQVTSGMEIIRQISRVPCDINDRPKVPIIIVGCGQLGGSSESSDAASLAGLSSLNKRAVEARLALEAARRVAALKGGVAGGAGAGGDDSEEEDDDEDEDVGGLWSAVASVKTDLDKSMEGRLKSLEQHLNAARRLNSKEVAEEQKVALNPKLQGILASQAERHIDASLRGVELAAVEQAGGVKRKRNDPANLLHETAESSELREDKRQRKEESSQRYGWEVFSQEAVIRAHEKKTLGVLEKQSRVAWDKQKQGLDQGVLEAVNKGKLDTQDLTDLQFAATHAVSEADAARVAKFYEDAATKKEDFSRRRAFKGESDVDAINKRNQKFNQKLERAFGDVTRETKQNLERGTAL